MMNANHVHHDAGLWNILNSTSECFQIRRWLNLKMNMPFISIIQCISKWKGYSLGINVGLDLIFVNVKLLGQSIIIKKKKVIDTPDLHHKSCMCAFLLYVKITLAAEGTALYVIMWLLLFSSLTHTPQSMCPQQGCYTSTTLK